MSNFDDSIARRPQAIERAVSALVMGSWVVGSIVWMVGTIVLIGPHGVAV
jgi:hypothetical protein